MSVRSLRQLVMPERVLAVPPTGAVPGWAQQLELNLFAPGFAGERMTLGSLGTAPAEAVLGDLEALPAGPFLALIALPQRDPVGLLERLHAKGCRGAIIVGGGMEPLALSLEARHAMQARARELGVRLLGPTRLGLLLPRLGLSAGAASALPRAGDLAFITQSDAITTAMLDWAAARGIGFSLVASLGDSMDVRLDDFLDLLAVDRHTRAILIQLEGVQDARRFMSAARAASRSKPVVVIRSGRHAVDAEGEEGIALALRDEAYEAAFRRAGMLRVRGIEDLFATAHTLGQGVRVRRSRLRSGRLAIVSNGRGPAMLATDALLAGGGTLARLSPATLHEVALALGPVSGACNLFDLGLEAGPDAFAGALPPLLRDPGCDAVLTLFSPGATEPPERYAAAVAGLQPRAREAQRLLLAAWLGEATVMTARRMLEEAQIPCYATPEDAIRAFLDLVAYERRQHVLQQIPAAQQMGDGPRREPVAGIVREALATGRTSLTGFEIARLLEAYELPPPGRADQPVDGLEAVLRVGLDETFGPVIRLAQGAPGDAVIGEAATALPPLNPVLAEAMLEETALGRLLLARGDPRLPDPEHVVASLLRLSQLVVDRPEIVAAELELRLSAEGAETLRASFALAPVPDEVDPTARLAIRPYPVELEETIRLKDGAQARLRPIRPEDAAAMQRAFKLMSAEDTRFRLFGPMRELSPDLAARLTQIDYDRELALVAEDPQAPGELIGGARVTMDPDGRRAEFAVTVRSDQKSRGIGRITLEKVLDYAARHGVEQVWGTILADNAPMLGLAARLGFSITRDPDEPDAVLAIKQLASGWRFYTSQTQGRKSD